MSKTVVIEKRQETTLMPHKHLNLDHTDNGIPITKEEQAIIDKVRRRYNLR